MHTVRTTCSIYRNCTSSWAPTATAAATATALTLAWNKESAPPRYALIDLLEQKHHSLMPLALNKMRLYVVDCAYFESRNFKAS